MANYFSDLVDTRYSCRDYDPERPVEHEKLVQCIEAARLAPSACNSQPWHFTVIEERDKILEAAKCLQNSGMNKFTDNAGALIVINEEYAKLKALIAEKMDSQVYAQIDIGIAAAHICYEAASLGLKTCILGWMDEEALKEVLHIPQEKIVRLVIAVGYAREEKHYNKKRKPLDEICDFIR